MPQLSELHILRISVLLGCIAVSGLTYLLSRMVDGYKRR